MRILTIIAVLLLAGSASAQIKFFKLYSDAGDDSGEGIVQLEDSSYAVTGSSSSFIGPGSQAFLLRIDSLGNYLWSYDYGGNESEGGKRVMYKNGMGFYIAGYTNSIGSGGYDFYLLKTDENGTFQWEKAYGGTGWERVHDAQMTRDDGVLMVGETSSNDTDNQDMYIVRTDSNGDTLWTKTLGGSGHDVLTGLLKLNDSTFYTCGYQYIEDSSYTKGYVAKLYDNGTISWWDTVGTYGNYKFHDLCFNHDTTLVSLVGEATGPLTVGQDRFFYRMFLDGSFYHENLHGGNDGDQRATCVTTYGSAADKYYVVANYFDQWSFDDGYDMSLARYNDFFFWESTGVVVNYPLPDLGNQVIPTSDGGAILVGKTNSEGEGLGPNHIFVAKVGPNDDFPNFNSPHDMGQLVTVQELFEDGELTVYPNPANSLLTVRMDVNEQVNLNVLNSVGQEVMPIRQISGSTNINVSGLADGLYYLQFELNGLRSVCRIVIQH